MRQKKKVKVTHTNAKRAILARVEDLVANLVYYDRKGDEEIGVAEFEHALASGDVKIGEILETFKNRLKDSIAHLNLPEQDKPSVKQPPKHIFRNGILNAPGTRSEGFHELSDASDVLEIPEQFERLARGDGYRDVSESI